MFQKHLLGAVTPARLKADSQGNAITSGHAEMRPDAFFLFLPRLLLRLTIGGPHERILFRVSIVVNSETHVLTKLSRKVA